MAKVAENGDRLVNTVPALLAAGRLHPDLTGLLETCATLFLRWDHVPGAVKALFREAVHTVVGALWHNMHAAEQARACVQCLVQLAGIGACASDVDFERLFGVETPLVACVADIHATNTEVLCACFEYFGAVSCVEVCAASMGTSLTRVICRTLNTTSHKSLTKAVMWTLANLAMDPDNRVPLLLTLQDVCNCVARVEKSAGIDMYTAQFFEQLSQDQDCCFALFESATTLMHCLHPAHKIRGETKEACARFFGALKRHPALSGEFDRLEEAWGVYSEIQLQCV